MFRFWGSVRCRAPVAPLQALASSLPLPLPAPPLAARNENSLRPAVAPRAATPCGRRLPCLEGAAARAPEGRRRRRPGAPRPSGERRPASCSPDNALHLLRTGRSSEAHRGLLRRLGRAAASKLQPNYRLRSRRAGLRQHALNMHRGHAIAPSPNSASHSRRAGRSRPGAPRPSAQARAIDGQQAAVRTTYCVPIGQACDAPGAPRPFAQARALDTQGLMTS